MRRILSLLLGIFLCGIIYGQSITANGPTSFCQGKNVILSVQGAPAGATFQWQNNGANIGVTAASFTATTSGNYGVVVSTAGNPDTTYGPVAITVFSKPVVNFTFSPNNQCGTTPISFTNTSTGNGITYKWDFGDPASDANNESTNANPTHHFVGPSGNGAQSFTVKLVVTTADGCSDSISKTVAVSSPSTILSGPPTKIYNGQTYFTQCSSQTTATFTFFNTSLNNTSNTNFRIVWGDNTPDFVSTSFPFATSQTHTYGLGDFSLLFIVTNNSGCTDTGFYKVFVGSNPAVGLENPGNTTICTGTSLTFPISGTATNQSNTLYTVTFNDGTGNINFAHPAPASVTHTFDKGSCGVFSGGYANSFAATITASNPCLTSSATVAPIFVSQKPKMGFAITPRDTVCVNSTLTVTNTSGSIDDVISGNCSAGKSVWSVSPATGWTVVSGSLGSDNGVNIPNVWTSGTGSVSFNFTTPGTYTIKLKGGNQNCGLDSSIRTICVNPAPLASFTVNTNTGCAPLNVTTTNNSNVPLCGGNTYQWDVTYSNTSGCTPAINPNIASSTLAQPSFNLTNPGVYTIRLITRNSFGLCTSAPFTQTVTVKTKPQGTINAPNAVCQNGTINPSAVVNNCFATTAATYQWTFTGGTPATSTSSSPGPITYNASGNYTITLEVTNECGTTTITKNIVVNPAPDVSVPANKTYCAGEPTGALTFTGSVTGTIYSWTNTNTAIGLAASGTGSIANFIAANNTGAPITASITVTPTSGCSGIPQTFTITVNPRPAKPTVVRPVAYCLNETAVPLSATATGSNSLNWYTVYQGTAAATVPTPSTATAGSTTYFVTQSNSFNCESDTARIVVTVHPKIANNQIAADQTICNGSSAQPLTPQGAISGGSGSYSYQWQQSTDGGTTWTNITGATAATYNPGAVTADTKFRRLVTSSSCADTSNIITINVQGSLTNAGISAAQTICQGTRPDTLRGQTPTGGNGTFTYQWESSTNNSTWTPIAGATGTDFWPPVLNTTTYYRRRVSSGQCSVYSSSIEITVNPKPVLTPVTDRYFCNNTATGQIAFGSTPPNVAYAWLNDNTAIGLAASGNANIASFTTTNNSIPKVPIVANIKVAPTFNNNSVGCVGDTGTFKIFVLPTIALAPIPDTSLCTGQTMSAYVPVPDTGSHPGISIQYGWTVSGGGISLAATGTGPQIPSFTTNNPGTTDLVATITVTPRYTFGGQTCNGTPTTYRITVKPATANANAGPDQLLCAQTTANLSATVVAGTTGAWTQIAGSATITAPTSNGTTVTGLVPGNVYQFVWTQTGFASCPATKDTVVIDNKNPLVNKIDTVSKTICANNTINIAGQVPTGGSGTYTYQWEQSTNGINFTPIAGATAQNITVAPTTTIWLRRFVNAAPCNSYSDTVKINVQPALTNNNISADATICTGLTAPTINGSLPSGGDNNFTYVWQQSTNGGGTWTTIAGATNVDYSPSVLTQTTQYRRIVSTSLCSGPFGSTSNVVTITVNPDAKALFLPTDTVKCPPFAITPAVINLQPSAANNQYIWYANGVQIGTGTTFPDYTITNENDSVIIKLKVISTFGCKDDSLSRKFKTIKKPSPSFTLSDTVGCGPITILAINTSTYMNEFTYFWDFGNGQTSTAAQPTAVTFAPNPNYGDTTYLVKLKVFSPCDTLTFVRSIRVKSKPKALFTPTKTTGCSPMTVTFRNTSKGLNNTYFWDFGDGTTLSTATADSVQHTFITGVVDTFYVKLRAVNECGSDSQVFSIIVAPNTIKLNLAVNGTDRFGCTPHLVLFVNNSQGASVFSWNFGDGATTTTTKNIDTVRHTYLAPGTYTLTLRAYNNCSDTTTTETITVYPKPRAAFTANKFTICIGDNVQFTNLSDSATAYLWKFGDGATSTLTSPSHLYNTAGSYIVTLISYRNNPSGNVCTDSTKQTVTVTTTQTGLFTVSDSVSNCAPFTVTLVNQNRPAVTTSWDMGDGTIRTGDSIVHTYAVAGTYVVTLTARVPGGCTYITTKTITVNGPKGTLQYNGGFVCHPSAVRFQAVSTGASNYIWDFGDGTVINTTQQTVFHAYNNPGFYLPKVTMQNGTCNIVLQGRDTIKVDKVDGGFTFSKTEVCGSTTLSFTDTSHVFSGLQSIRWNFGDNTTGTGSSPSHVYTASGRYTIQMIVLSRSGCADTVTRQIDVMVKSKPVVSINAMDTACTRRSITFNALVQTVDPINFIQWNVSNGATGTGAVFNHTFTQAGVYNLRLVVGTTNGCYDTAVHTIVINPSPVVTATSSLDLCRGNTVQLNAIGAATWQWLPLSGLSCYNCPSPLASPTITTPYVVEGKNSFGCADYDTVVITVIQPLRMTVSPNDSICIGQSTNLLVSGAASYNWSPAVGLSSTTVSNPTAAPTVTTRYRVVGYDGFNCFTDTAFITVAIGQYPTVSLGPDQTLATGTLLPLSSVITNGPIRNWAWSPTTNLSCASCPLPIAEVKKDITYTVKVTTPYGCSASDTISIKTFCKDGQVFIPNAFTPDGDGVNDRLIVRASGIAMVKHFRIFNRWGDLIFERDNFKPNDITYSWDGRVRGVVSGPEVFVYTCEVICENGTSYTYKGNVSIIK